MKTRGACRLALVAILAMAAGKFPPAVFGADETQERKVSREEIYEFAEKPRIAINGSDVEITFTAKAHCDATVAIENAAGEIVRHLACGVLGDKAPAPFQKGSLRQSLRWDGKDDRGKYVDDLGALSVRVSLGLQPKFEKSLYEEPKRRYSREGALFCPTAEGVYVYDGGNGADFVRLFDHDGNYKRTVYPFPADKIKDVAGLFWHDYPEDGAHLPIKPNFLQNSLLTGGTQAFNMINYLPAEKMYRTVNASKGTCHFGMEGRGAMTMAVRNGRIALANNLINRFATDGSSGGMQLSGPRTVPAITVENVDYGNKVDVAPHSSALSPDGKTLYLTGYIFSHKSLASADIIKNGRWACFHGVYALSMDSDAPLKLFVGSDKVDEAGSDNTHFKVPASVAVDNTGLVYVADYLNDRVQVYSAVGEFVRTIKISRPAQLFIDSEHGELIVASFVTYNVFQQSTTPAETVPATLTRMGPLSNPVKIVSYPLPVQSYLATPNYFFYMGCGVPISLGYDPHGASPTLWITEEYPMENVMTRGHARSNVRLFEVKEKTLVPKRDFTADVKNTSVRAEPAHIPRQRMNVNPRTGKLYLCEDQSLEIFQQVIELDPETGKQTLLDLPLDVEDLCIDSQGLFYMKTYSALVRYNLDAGNTWREVPWDYGEEFSGKDNKLTASVSSSRRETEAQSALPLPANGSWHHGGMFVSLKGNLVAGCKYWLPGWEKTVDKTERASAVPNGRVYAPALYPGRSVGGRGGGIFVHVWDPRGKLLYDDAAPGLADNTYGLGLDADDNIYALSAGTRVYAGKKYFNDMSGTLLKFKPKVLKIVSTDATPVPMPSNEVPSRSPDLANAAQGNAWIQNDSVEWTFGGVGFCGKNMGVGCACWNCRFGFDYFNRSFAPELDRYSVAVLDAAGNLIVRVGRYGNADSAGPDSLVPMGGDEVGLLHGAYVAVDTDKRMFIADPMNGRIVSVRMGYHQTEKALIQSIPDFKAIVRR